MKRAVDLGVQIHRLQAGEEGYPCDLATFCGKETPAALGLIGPRWLLAGFPKLAVFCSVRCPGNLILRTYDLAQKLRHSAPMVVSGFHSPMEQECFTILLRGPQPMIYCPARGLDRMQMRAGWRKPLAEGRLLILSGFGPSQRRPTEATALRRNRMVAALANGVFVAHAAPGTKTYRLCEQVLSWGKPLYTFDDPANADLISSGARPVAITDCPDCFLSAALQRT